MYALRISSANLPTLGIFIFLILVHKYVYEQVSYLNVSAHVSENLVELYDEIMSESDGLGARKKVVKRFVMPT